MTVCLEIDSHRQQQALSPTQGEGNFLWIATLAQVKNSFYRMDIVIGGMKVYQRGLKTST